MDDSKKFIKMSEKSPLKESWEPKSGDWVVRRYEDVLLGHQEEVQILIRHIDVAEGYWVIVNEKGESRLTNDELKKKLFIPLFRQDQLQEMVRLKDKRLNTPTVFVKRLFHWAYGSIYWEYEDWNKRYNQAVYVKQFDSMEQLCHAFVVWEKYQKIWDDEKEEWMEK